MHWIVVVAVLAVLGYFLDREVYFYEGVHLGPRIQAWLYDRWSRKYDESKRASQLQDDEMLAAPLCRALQEAGMTEPFVLDFATGTGRLSYALLKQPEFRGRIVALDLSTGMLVKASSKLSPMKERVEFLRHQTLPLPFPDGTFDVVCALEVLELFPHMEEPLSELTRVLRPGGILLTSRGTEESGRRARVKSTGEFSALLQRYGVEQAQLTKWWKLFDRVLGRRMGSSDPVARRSLGDVLRCPGCGEIRWQQGPTSWSCQSCDTRLTVTGDGILLNSK